jgi:hypothetical protein
VGVPVVVVTVPPVPGRADPGLTKVPTYCVLPFRSRVAPTSTWTAPPTAAPFAKRVFRPPLSFSVPPETLVLMLVVDVVELGGVEIELPGSRPY